MGLHPTYVKENYKEELEIVADYLSKSNRLDEVPSFAAIGEIGLDYHWDLTFKEQQIEAFETQIDWALQYNLPIVIHSRESTEDCISSVRKKQNSRLKGIFHCFGGTLQQAQEIVSLGLHLGIGGTVTYKNNTVLHDVIKNIPLTSIVLETDAPYLSPAPHRGKRNESSYIPIIAQKIADLKEISLDEVERVTNGNAEKIFPVPKPGNS